MATTYPNVLICSLYNKIHQSYVDKIKDGVIIQFLPFKHC